MIRDYHRSEVLGFFLTFINLMKVIYNASCFSCDLATVIVSIGHLLEALTGQEKYKKNK